MAARFGKSQARRYYDANAGKQDRQGWYEDAALRQLVEAGQFAQADRVVEAGCGTGLFAQWLLEGPLPGTAHYWGIDMSAAMLARARERLEPHSTRVQLVQGDATERLPLGDACCDRFVAAYLIDLLAPEQALALIAEAHRVLRPGGLLCLASLTRAAPRGIPSIIARAWNALATVAPARVGGCRPVLLVPMLPTAGWDVVMEKTVAPRGVASGVVVARRI